MAHPESRFALSPQECADLIRQAQRIVALTGAGISTAAGIPDFRGPQGLYASQRYDPMAIFDLARFQADPRPFFAFARDFLDILDRAQPTFAHRFLARLEEEGRLTAVVTQNIDMLHEKAGTRRIIALHGDYRRSRCLTCDKAWNYAEMSRKIKSEEVPRCGCGGVIKPEVVFFGEAVRDLDAAYAAVANCDLLLVLGSSLQVYPAAALPDYASGAVVAINRGAIGLTPAPNRFWVAADLQEYMSAVALAR